MGTRKEIRVKDLIWNKYNREHITNHEVHPHHVDEVMRDPYKVAIPAKKNRIMVIGRCGRRILTVILNREQKKLYVVTARDANKQERTLYRQTSGELASS